MKKLLVLALAMMILAPSMAFAGSATDAALGLGAFAVFNQILGGVGVFGAPVRAYAAPAPVYAAPPIYVAPAPVYVAPAPVFVARPPVVVARPIVIRDRVFVRRAPGFFAPVHRHAW
jgi:hypothetical protein